ncbi:MAG: hypothetical protein R2827_04820 [Bdellovibrionales bacterium]
MAIQIHSKAGAFSPGSNLWVLPQLKQSNWTKTVDWYLNFQVSRMSGHKAVELSEPIRHIMEQSEHTYIEPKLTEDAPLLIASANRLPNSQTVVLQFDGKIDDWFKRIKLIWYKLNRPRMRIFLPTAIKESEIIRYWPNMEEQHLVTFVPFDSEAIR